MERNSSVTEHSAGMMLTPLPPSMRLTDPVVYGIGYASSNGPSARHASLRSRQYRTTDAACSMAFTPCAVSDECAARPRTVTRTRLIDLCPRIIRIEVGSPTKHTRGWMPTDAIPSTRGWAPMQPTSSS